MCICIFRIRRSSSNHLRLRQHRRMAPTQHKISPCRRESELRYDCVVTGFRQQRSSFLHVSGCVFCPTVACSPVWHPWHLLWNAFAGSFCTAAAGEGPACREEAARPGNMRMQSGFQWQSQIKLEEGNSTDSYMRFLFLFLFYSGLVRSILAFKELIWKLASIYLVYKYRHPCLRLLSLMQDL